MLSVQRLRADPLVCIVLLSGWSLRPERVRDMKDRGLHTHVHTGVSLPGNHSQEIGGGGPVWSAGLHSHIRRRCREYILFPSPSCPSLPPGLGLVIWGENLSWVLPKLKLRRLSWPDQAVFMYTILQMRALMKAQRSPGEAVGEGCRHGRAHTPD
ncbi:hypothetical protein Bbelb_256340 [Branchiostoma belcheri]|nr:hypothetical protein Bbelb_256340 [Branchiostoma belcheri]